MMAVQGVPYGISQQQQQQMHHGPSPIPASPSPSISLMSGSSRASSSVQSRHIKTQSPVIMNQSSIVKSHQVLLFYNIRVINCCLILHEKKFWWENCNFGMNWHRFQYPHKTFF